MPVRKPHLVEYYEVGLFLVALIFLGELNWTEWDETDISPKCKELIKGVVIGCRSTVDHDLGAARSIALNLNALDLLKK